MGQPINLDDFDRYKQNIKEFEHFYNTMNICYIVIFCIFFIIIYNLFVYS